MQRARMHIRPPGPKSKEKLLPSGLYRRAPKPAETHPALKVVDIKFKSHHTTEAPGMIRTLVLLLQPNTSDPDPPVSPPRTWANAAVVSVLYRCLISIAPARLFGLPASRDCRRAYSAPVPLLPGDAADLDSPAGVAAQRLSERRDFHDEPGLPP